MMLRHANEARAGIVVGWELTHSLDETAVVEYL